jgi:hypothetical protein
MTKMNRAQNVKQLAEADRSIINDFVEAATILAGDGKDGRGNPANSGVAFCWGHASIPECSAPFVGMILQAGAAAVSLEFVGKPSLDGGPAEVVVVFEDRPGHSTTYPACQFWMAEGSLALFLVSPGMNPVQGHFALVGGRLEYRASWPASDVEPGIALAAEFLRTAVAKLREVKGCAGTTMHEVRFAA